MIWMKGFNAGGQEKLERIARSLEAIETALNARAALAQADDGESDDPSDDGSDWDCHDSGPYALA